MARIRYPRTHKQVLLKTQCNELRKDGFRCKNLARVGQLSCSIHRDKDGDLGVSYRLMPVKQTRGKGVRSRNRFYVTERLEGYGKGTYIVKDSKGRIYPSGGLLKTPTRAKNHLVKVKARYAGWSNTNMRIKSISKGKKVSAKQVKKGR